MLKISGGQFAGRTLSLPSSATTRPVTEKNRASIFNSLFSYVLDAKVLDLYAGSGALSFEALSRGAATAMMIEKSNKVVGQIKENIERLGVGERATVESFDVAHWLKRDHEQRYDLIFFDPPYVQFDTALAEMATNLLQSGGILVVSMSSRSKMPESIGEAKLLKEKKYGDSQFGFFQKLL
ncbi:16S rRNA (guanine(966)-N(2))-methyltransferase RsmD [bacterium]|nr:16S rRNA (guanine(966)-N(2))-methyltransferase RsmD [bacterium]